MKLKLAIFLTLATPLVQAQPGGSITVFGGMGVQEGGRARTLGRLFFENQHAAGAFAITFDNGSLVSIRTTQILEIFIPGSTSFFTAKAIGSVRENGQLRLVPGTITVMVDDLDHDLLQFPDTIFVQFNATDGRSFIRHGTLDQGEVVIVLP